ncbi:MAG: Sua5/YciO/YrdC/YwlC family protein [Chromatiales bacterium]|jgi:L-threonylcarbamoyladenylate synthase
MAPEDPPADSWRLRNAARRLREGAILAYPTEGVYGLGCDPLNRAAVERILVLKQRPAASGLILVAADFFQLEPFVRALGTARMREIEASWPGPHTWLLPAAHGVPPWLRGEHTTLAVRVTAHPLAAALCRAFGGPLVSTSANRSGRAPALCPLQVRLRCPGVDLVIHGPLGGRPGPSVIQDGATGRLIRA